VVRRYAALLLWLGLSLFILLPAAHAAGGDKQLIYDEAKLLTADERAELNALANQYGPERETDIIIYTSNNDKGADVLQMTEDFYDQRGPGYDKKHGNAVILTMDMKHREIYLAGFYKAESYLNNERLDKIRDRITPALAEGEYAKAFEQYIRTAYRYMDYAPGVNPDSIFFQLWFQIGVSVIFGVIVVGLMVRHREGRVEVNRYTYQDFDSGGLIEHHDNYLRTTTTRTRITNTNSGGSGGSGGGSGGGGVSGGGHSHSGSRGSF